MMHLKAMASLAALSLALAVFTFSAVAGHGVEAPDEVNWLCANPGVREDVIDPVPVTECEDGQLFILSPDAQQIVNNTACENGASGCTQSDDGNYTWDPTNGSVPEDLDARQTLNNTACENGAPGNCTQSEDGNHTWDPTAVTDDLPTSPEAACEETEGAIPGCVKNDNGTADESDDSYTFDPASALDPDGLVPDEPIPEDVPMGLGCKSRQPEQFVGAIIYDTDCDGTTTANELAEGCDPTDPESHPTREGQCEYNPGRLLEDAPVPTGCTSAFPSDPTDPAQWDQFLGLLVLDTDCDGQTTLNELKQGCDPLDPNSYPGGPTACDRPPVG